MPVMTFQDIIKRVVAQDINKEVGNGSRISHLMVF